MNDVEFPLVFEADFVDGEFQMENCRIMHCWDDVLRYLNLENEKNIYVDVHRISKECNEGFPHISRFDILIGDAYNIIRYKELSDEWKIYYELAPYPRKGKCKYIKDEGLCIKDTVPVATLGNIIGVQRYERHFYEIILL